MLCIWDVFWPLDLAALPPWLPGLGPLWLGFMFLSFSFGACGATIVGVGPRGCTSPNEASEALKKAFLRAGVRLLSHSLPSPFPYSRA